MKLKISSNGYIDINSENWMHSENSEVIQWLSEGNTPEPEFTEEELLTQKQNEFRVERNNLLAEADIEINKLVDLGLDSTEWRVYRQELRDSTLTLVLPSKPEGVK